MPTHNLTTDFYAHSLEGRSPRDWEPLTVHLQAVATRAAEFASVFGGADWAHLAGRWHDLGKYSAAFQSYLQETADKHGPSKVHRGPDHSTAGAQHAVAHCSKEAGRVLAYCIAGHHGGLPDATDTETGGESGLDRRLSKPIPPFDSAPSELLEAPDLSPPVLRERDASCGLACSLSVLDRRIHG